MLVDNPLFQPSYFTTSSSYPEYPTTDLNDIFDTELFNNTFATGSSIHSSTPSGSRGSTPQNLLTPPQGDLPTSFPEIHDEESANNGLFPIFEDDLKTIDPLSIPTNSNDFMSVIDNMYGAGGAGGYGIDMGGYGGMPMDLSSMGIGMNLMDDSMQVHGIDPQLVDTPSAVSDNGEDESDEKESPASPPSPEVVEKKEPEKPTIVIAPVKVGGHGKARKGTVQSGGVVKKSASFSPSREKENAIATFSSSSSSTTKKPAAQTKATTPVTSSGLFSAGSTSSSFLTGGGSANADSEAGDAEDEDDLPQDWRPSPEVFAKMTSKEKRQLRNKISARNFRVRRKGLSSNLVTSSMVLILLFLLRIHLHLGRRYCGARPDVGPLPYPTGLNRVREPRAEARDCRFEESASGRSQWPHQSSATCASPRTERRRSTRRVCLSLHLRLHLRTASHCQHTERPPHLTENGQPLLGWRGYRWWVHTRAYDACAGYQHLCEEGGARECGYQHWYVDKEGLAGEYEPRDERPAALGWRGTWSYEGARWVRWVLGSQSVHNEDTRCVCFFFSSVFFV